MALLTRQIQDFVKAGGVVTVADWMAMDKIERAILIHLRDPGLRNEVEALQYAADRAIALLRASSASHAGGP